VSVFAAVNHQPYLAQPRRQGEHNAQNQGYGSVNAQFHILQLPPHLGADADGEGQQAAQDEDNKGCLHAETNSVGNFVYPIGHFQRARKNRLLRWPDGNGPLDFLDDGAFREALRDRRPV